MPQCFTIMNNDNNHNTIQEFDVNLICDFFLNTNRQGPGSPEATLKEEFYKLKYCSTVVYMVPRA